MSIEHIQGKRTGIYREPDKVKATGDDMQAVFHQFADAVNQRPTMPDRLQAIEDGLLDLLKAHGVKTTKRNTPKPGERLAMVNTTSGNIAIIMPDEPTPLIEDAIKALGLLAIVRLNRDPDNAIMHAMQLGMMLERVTVRQFEAVLWVKAADAAKFSGVHRGTIGKAGNDGTIYHNGKTGRERMYLMQSVTAYARQAKRVKGAALTESQKHDLWRLGMDY